MKEILMELDQIYTDYSHELEVCEKKQKVTDGLFGFGHSIKDDPCHEKFYERIMETLKHAADTNLSSDDAEQIIYYLFKRKKEYPYPPSAQLMLCAVEKHIIPLIPFLNAGASDRIYEEYDSMYKRWERLPVQKEVWKALKQSVR